MLAWLQCDCADIEVALAYAALMSFALREIQGGTRLSDSHMMMMVGNG